MDFKKGLSGVADLFEPNAVRWGAAAAVVVATAAVTGVVLAERGSDAAASAVTGVSDAEVAALATARFDEGETSMASEMPESVEVAALPLEAAPVVEVARGPVCGPDAVASGKTLVVAATSLNVRIGPGSRFDRVVDESASSDAGGTVYVQLNQPAQVVEMCRKGAWSQVQVGDLEAALGWVSNRYLQAN